MDRFVRNAMVRLKKAADAWYPSAESLNDYAWYLLTCERPQFRNCPRALELAKQAVAKTGGKIDRHLDTLAYAYFHNGNKPKALETQRKAVAMLPPGASSVRTDLESRLRDFEKAVRQQ